MDSEIESDDETTAPCTSAMRQKIEAGSSRSGTTRKWTCAAVYKTKFQKRWQQAWPFAVPVKDPHSFHCTTCMKLVS